VWGVLMALVLLCAAGVAGGDERGADVRRVLRVGTVADYAPFSFVDRGELCGFEIDMAKEIGERLGYEVCWRDCPFESVLSELLLGEVDVIAAGMTVTAERARVVAFTAPYFKGDPMVCMYPARLGELSEAVLGTKRLIVIEGYTHESYAVEVLRVEPLRLQCSADAVMALRAGQADGFITSKTTAAALMGLLGEGWDVLEFRGTGEDCAMLLQKGDDELLGAINGVIGEMEEEGVIEMLRKKWGI